MKHPNNKATLLFLRRDNQILLAMKKRGFGEGRWNGVGGKVGLGERVEQAAVRECQEEILVRPIEYKQVADIDFIFPHNSGWDVHASVYICTQWQGEPTETEEMRPQWYDLQNIPYDEMWVDDKLWLPLVIKGLYVKASFSFDSNDNIIKQEIVAA